MGSRVEEETARLEPKRFFLIMGVIVSLKKDLKKKETKDSGFVQPYWMIHDIGCLDEG